MIQDNQPQIVYFTVPKIGEGEEDIQDACSWSQTTYPMRAAIADGVSTSLWPREWADLLVHQLCNDTQPIDDIVDKWEEWLKPIQEQWRQFYLQQQNQKLPWYAKGSKEKNSGGATFVCLHIFPPSSPEGQRKWEAIAVGDSCLFHIKANTGEIHQAFPLDKPELFSTVTHAVPSLSDYKHKQPRPTKIDNVWGEGDIFLLATDALAEFLLKQQNQPEILQQLIQVSSQTDFAELIKKFRHDQLIKNDDTTLCRILVTAKTPNIPSPPSLNLVGSSAAPSPQSVPTPVGAAAANWQPAGGNAQRQSETPQGNLPQPETTETSRDNPKQISPPAPTPQEQTNPPVVNPPATTPSPGANPSSVPTVNPSQGIFQPGKKNIFRIGILVIVAIALGVVFRFSGALGLIKSLTSRTPNPQSPPTEPTATSSPATGSPAPSPIQTPTTSPPPVEGAAATAAPPATTAPSPAETTQSQNTSLKPNNNPVEQVPIYLDSGNNNQPSGYLWKASAPQNPGAEKILLWVHTPNSYLTQANTGDNSVLTIPNESTPLALYVDKPTPPDLSAEDFAGYLLPGTYQVSQSQVSTTFAETSWVKVSVLLKQEGAKR